MIDRKERRKQLVKWFLNTVMEEEANIQISAGPYERPDKIKAHRNGTRTRTLKTVDGVLQLNKSQVMEFPFEIKVFEKYSRIDKAIDSVILESYINGVSTRNIRNVVAALGLENVSASYVSSLSSELDVKVKQFLERRLAGHVKFIYIDATYFSNGKQQV